MVPDIVGKYNTFVIHISFYSSILSSIISLILFIALFQRRKKSPLYFYFSILLFGFFTWNIFSIGYFKYAREINLGFNTAETLSTEALKRLFMWGKLNTIGLLLIGPSTISSMYYFSYEKYKWIKKMGMVMWILLPISYALLFSPLFESPLWATISFIMIYLPGFFGSGVFLYESKKAQTYYVRKRNFYMFLSSLIIVLAGITNLLNGYTKIVPPLSNIFYIIYVLILFYIIVEMHLFRVKNVLRKLVIYALVTVVYTCLASIVFLYIGYTESVTVKIFMIFMFVFMSISSYSWLYNFLVKFLEYSLHEKVEEYLFNISVFQKKVLEKDNLTDILRTFILHVSELIGVDGGVIFVKIQDGNYAVKDIVGLEMEEYVVPSDSDIVKFFTQQDGSIEYLIMDEIRMTPWVITDAKTRESILQWMSKNDIELIIPIREENDNILSFVMFGEKQSLMPYTDEDINIIRILFTTLRLSIRNVFLYEKMGTMGSEIAMSRKELMKMKEAKMISEVIRGIVHDFKNMITGLKGRIDIIKLDPSYPTLPESIRMQIMGMERAAERAIILSKKSLSFSHNIKEKKIYQKIYLKEFLSKLYSDWKIKELEVEHKIKINIEIIMDIPEDIYVYFSELDLGRIMDNLIYNAIEAIMEKRKDGKVFIKVYEADNDMVTIDVIDTGIGIPVELQKEMFGLFFTTKKDGTGVGLSTAKALLNSVGGSISFRTEYGKGTTFTVVLPKKENI